MTSNRHLTSMDRFDTMVLQAKHKECNMGYTIEFNDDAMRYADYAAVEQYQAMRLPLSFVEELMDSKRATRSVMSSSFSSFSSVVTAAAGASVATGGAGSTSIASVSVMFSVVSIESDAQCGVERLEGNF